MADTLLLTGASGSGKTRAAVQQVVDELRRNPFATIWVALPTELQIENFRARLLTALDQPTCFGVSYFDFYDLYAHLLQIVGQPQRRIDPATQLRILRASIRIATPELQHFAAIAEQPGFVTLTADFIRELKQARITPAQFEIAAHDAKDRDLALIYRHYQETLQSRDLVDIEGEGWLALARVRDLTMLPVEVALLIVDDFDQFNRVQAELLGLLTERISRTVITLTYEPERAETAHRRFAQTRERLTQFVRYTEERLNADAAESERPATLSHLSQILFEAVPAFTPDDNALILIEAPDPRREVEYVFRVVKRVLLSGVPPDQIAVVARDLTPYSAYLLERAATYGIPIAAQLGTPLSENPAVASILALIDLATAEFPRRVLLDTLRNPYLACPDLTTAQIDQLDAVSRMRIVIGGREQWLEALAAAPLAKQEDEDSEAVDVLVIDLDALRASLTSFFERVTPPPTATARAYVRWLETLLGADVERGPGDEAAFVPQLGFQVIANIRAWPGAPALVARDLNALATFKRALAELLAACDLLDETEPIPWAQFRLDLDSALAQAIVKPARGTGRSGRVLIGSIFDVRGLPHQYLYVLGLSEGQFPARDREDALYLDAERQALNKGLTSAGVFVATRADHPDEAALFYEMTALARRQLTLSRPYSDAGNPWPPSAYWQAAQAAVHIQPIHIRMDSVLHLDEAACVPEALVAVTYRLKTTFDAAVNGAARWFREHPIHAVRWRRAHSAQLIELRRATGVKDAYSGYLSLKITQAAVAYALGPDRLWSAQQFNEYGLCPFGFFAKRLLNLQPLDEPEAGLDNLQIGSIYHAILEELYRQIGQERLSITLHNLSRALTMLNAVCNRVFSNAPNKYGFRPDALWDQQQNELRQRLRLLVENDFSADGELAKHLPGERHPFREESWFGEVVIDGDGGPLRVRGRIDRIDVTGGQALVIDYKSGSTAYSKSDLLEGRNVQMLVYLLAARQAFDFASESVCGAFWHISNRKLSGKLNTSSDTQTIQDAIDRLHQRVIAARRAEFPNIPSKPATDGKCTRYCEFSRLCRVRANAAMSAEN
ncbi:MAG: PD-(D/E)XK nuclease family protein [Aggregatilineales bacterium]